MIFLNLNKNKKIENPAHSTTRVSAQGCSLLDWPSGQSDLAGLHRVAAFACTETGHRGWCACGGDVRGATLAGEEPRAVGHEHRGQKGELPGMASGMEAHQNGRGDDEGGWRAARPFVPARSRVPAMAGGHRR
jgi:hypothetical protein